MNNFYTGNINIPTEIRSLIGNERVLFSVKAKYAYSRSVYKGLLFFALFWFVITSLVSAAFFGPLLTSGSSTFKLNGRTVTATMDNLTPLLFPGIFFGVFFLIGFGILYSAIKTYKKQGGYFIGTEKNLVRYDAEFQTYPWNSFNGKVNMSFSKQSITLELKTFRTKTTTRNLNRGNNGFSYNFGTEKKTSQQHDTVDIVGIDNVAQVTEICKKAIEIANSQVEIDQKI